MTKALISWNKKTKKYELILNDQVLVKSKNYGYLTAIVRQQKHDLILKHGIIEAITVSVNPADKDFTVLTPQNKAIIDIDDASAISLPNYTINERFAFMAQLIGMVVNRTAKSVFITGEGGVGKTFSVMEYLKAAGKVNYNELRPSNENLSIEVPDTENEMETKVLSPKGDYVVVKGHASAAALYRILFEHRDHLIIFDDCDSVLKDGGALNLLKSALDSYEERWISWRVERAFGESDLPSTFKFNGSIIFISNMPLAKIDEAVKTRCFKVDLSMTKPQRIERMRNVLDKVMPDVPIDQKSEALELLSENQHLTDDINFRALMNLISIRIDPAVQDWKSLGRFALTEQ